MIVHQNRFMQKPNRNYLVPRRSFLKQSALAGAALGLGAAKISAAIDVRKTPKPMPQPNKSGINHIVVVMMENRSFDHFLGWLPGANGQQAGLVYFTADNVGYGTYPLGGGAGGSQDYRGCGLADPNHSYQGGRVEFDGGACDGWLKPGANPNDTFSIGYYQQADLG